MLEKVDLTRKLAKARYKEVFGPMQLHLGTVQRQTRDARIPVVVLFEGWEAAGKGTCINRLVQRLDPRGFKVHPISAPNDEERLRPFLWRFAIHMPGAGRMAIFDRSWYGRVLVERVEGLVPEKAWKQAYEDIRQFERQHADAGAVIVKFWLHISRAEQTRRFKKIAEDPAQAWKVDEDARREHSKYKQYHQAVEEMLEKTSTAYAPWTIIEATCGRFARVKMLETITGAIQRALDNRPPPEVKQPAEAPARSVTGGTTLLDRVDLTQTLPKPRYSRSLSRLQKRLRQLEHEMFMARLPAIVLYEGWDAAGKGGNIKRLTGRLDPRGYEVIPIAAPTEQELKHQYLWRFWRHLPKGGHLTIFDRSWYGRVLVERVEGFCTRTEWQRAYQELNEFERMVADYGTVIVKFWIHISPEEQLRRFQEREKSTLKSWKLTDEDWRNREKWPIYHQAVVDMIRHTSTTYAPWTIVEGDDKYFARVRALKAVVAAIEQGLERARR